jgi:peptidoglycan/xylan/chitin deacetylase (PgdA/CDA1 family)
MIRTLTRADALSLAYAAASVAAIARFGVTPLALGLPSAILLALVADGIFRPGSRLLLPTICHGPRRGNAVALTFDDGPDPEVTPAVLDALTAAGARATFFCIGRALEQNPALARRMVAAGHELANHSWRHSRWQNFFSTAAQTREIERCARAIEKVSGATSALYRTPMGLKSPLTRHAAKSQNVAVIAWSVRSGDGRDDDPARIARRVLARVRAGDIVLLHDGHDRPGLHRRACAPALALILAGLRERGLECVSVSQLLAPERSTARAPVAAATS